MIERETAVSTQNAFVLSKSVCGLAAITPWLRPNTICGLENNHLLSSVCSSVSLTISSIHPLIHLTVHLFRIFLSVCSFELSTDALYVSGDPWSLLLGFLLVFYFKNLNALYKPKQYQPAFLSA